MREKQCKIRNTHAVSQVISTLLVLMIALGTVAMILTWGLPYLEEREMNNQCQILFSNFHLMSKNIEELLVEDVGTKRISNIKNSNNQGHLSINSQKDKLILVYSFDENYDFNVSGLDNDDDEFDLIIEKLSVDKMKIYWLDPSKGLQQLTPEILPPKCIYGDHWFAQSFKTPDLPSCTLEKIRLYLAKYGNLTDLYVSIYDTLGESPNYTSCVWEENISSEKGWVDCNFASDIVLNNDTAYFIVLNTAGGSIGLGDDNYYEWYRKKSVYDDGCEWYSYSKGSSWVQYHGYDFYRRIYYSGNKAPSTPCFEFNPSGRSFYSGHSASFNVTATDPEDDDIRYKIDWGDGINSSWSPLQSSEAWYGFSHAWGEPGSYTLTLQARDEYDNINELDAMSTIYVDVGAYLPEDQYYNETHDITTSGGGDSVTINPEDGSRDFSGTLRIDLFNISATSGEFRKPFGRIWVFELGFVSFISPYSVGTQKIFYENGAVLSTGTTDNRLISTPYFSENDQSLSFRIIQIDESTNTGGGGVGTYGLGLTMQNSFSREPAYRSVYNLKIQVSAEDSDVQKLWFNYFENKDSFTEADPPYTNTLCYKFNGKTLKLDNMVIEVNLEGVK